VALLPRPRPLAWRSGSQHRPLPHRGPGAHGRPGRCFAALSLGFFLGKRKVGTFSLGTSAGVLLAGVLIGQLRIPIPALLQAVFFTLFIFVVGYRVGPQFFRRLRGEGLRLAALALILAVAMCSRRSTRSLT
jgi:uncharacterized transporter YbjL